MGLTLSRRAEFRLSSGLDERVRPLFRQSLNRVPSIHETFWRLLTEGASHYAATILSIGVLVGIGLWLRSWYREDAGTAEDAHDLLIQFKELKRQGDLTEDEYRSIRSRLTGDRADSSANATDGSAKSGSTDFDGKQDANPQEI